MTQFSSVRSPSHTLTHITNYPTAVHVSKCFARIVRLLFLAMCAYARAGEQKLADELPMLTWPHGQPL